MPTYRPGRFLVYATTLLLVCQMVGHVLLTAGQFCQVYVLEGSLETASPDAPGFMATALLITFGAFGQLGALLFTMITFLTWFYRAAQNAQTFATDPLEHGAGWAIGGFFVPILNLVRPYQMARQIETASGGVGSGVISAWWAAFVINNLLGNVEFRLEDPTVLAWVGLASTVTAGIGAICCVQMMFYVEKLQADRSVSAYDVAQVFT